MAGRHVAATRRDSSSQLRQDCGSFPFMGWQHGASFYVVATWANFIPASLSLD